MHHRPNAWRRLLHVAPVYRADTLRQSRWHRSGLHRTSDLTPTCSPVQCRGKSRRCRLPPGGLRPQTPARGCDPWTTQALASGCAWFSVKARAPGGLPSPAYLTPVHPSCEGRATAYGWATNPGALGKSGQAIPGAVSASRARIARAHNAGTCARTASDGF